MAKRFVIPFATSGDKSVTPDATDPGGAISYSQGWPVAYQLVTTDPNYRPVGRQEMNGVLFDITGALAELQTLGFPEWVAVAGLVTPYAINATVRHNGNNWRNTVGNNSAEPGVDTTWVLSNEAPALLTTAGAAPSFTLTPSPAISAYAAGQLFRVKFNATPVGVPTLNVSGKGAKNLKQYDSTGAKIQGVVASGMITNIVYDGGDLVICDPLPPTVAPANRVGISGSAKNLKASASGSSALVPITADEIVVVNALGEFATLRNVAVSVSTLVSGLGGLDAGTIAANTWYYGFVVWNKNTGVVGGVISASDISPVLPSGFTHWARATSLRTAPTTNYPLSFTKTDSSYQYVVGATGNVLALPVLAGGVSGNPNIPTWTAVGVADFVPPTAKKINMSIGSPTVPTVAIVAPNNAYSFYGSASNPCPIFLNSATTVDETPSSVVFQFVLETRFVFYAAQGSGVKLRCLGWEE